MKLCTGINCPDKRSNCCNASFTTSIADEGTGCWVCDACHKPTDPQACTAGRDEPIFTKEEVEDAARYSNFSQAFKVLMWERGFSGEEKLEEVAMILFKKYVKKAVENERKRIEALIVDEILICYEEGTPTSRLTSLAMRIKELK